MFMLHTGEPGTSIVRGMIRAGIYHSLKAGTSVKFQFPLVFPRAIRGRITSKLNELKTALDAGRGGWSA